MNAHRVGIRRYSKLAAVVVLLITCVAYFVYSSRYRRRVAECNDVFAGIVLFLEAHDGAFPTSQEELVAESFHWDEQRGGFIVRDPGDSRFVGKVYKVPVRDLAEYRIDYGNDLRSIPGLDRDAESQFLPNDRLIVRCPLGTESSRQYTLALLRVASQMRSEKKVGIGS